MLSYLSRHHWRPVRYIFFISLLTDVHYYILGPKCLSLIKKKTCVKYSLIRALGWSLICCLFDLSHFGLVSGTLSCCHYYSNAILKWGFLQDVLFHPEMSDSGFIYSGVPTSGYCLSFPHCHIYLRQVLVFILFQFCKCSH